MLNSKICAELNKYMTVRIFNPDECQLGAKFETCAIYHQICDDIRSYYDD